MPRETWIIASVLTVALLLGLLGLTSWEKKNEVEKLKIKEKEEEEEEEVFSSPDEEAYV